MAPLEAAQIMLDELRRVRWLDQDDIAWKLFQLDAKLTYQNDNGNLAIDKKVLAEFKRLTSDGGIVWSRSERQWRFREPYDQPGRMQD